jgi:hypothetical protein
MTISFTIEAFNLFFTGKYQQRAENTRDDEAGRAAIDAGRYA